MKPTLATILIGLALLAGCEWGQTRYRVTLVTDQQWTIGEAKTCSFDGEYMEMHCFPPTALLSDKHDYLVDADFDAPVQFDANRWSVDDGYPYNTSCRLDSVSHATCNQQTPTK